MRIFYLYIISCVLGMLPFSATCQPAYRGGSGNGFKLTIALSNQLGIADSLYNGGQGIGYSRNIIVTGLGILDSVYNGGIGQGYQSTKQNNAALFLVDSVYNGGVGRGEDVFNATGINLAICAGNIIVWNGNSNVNWENPGNWNCGVVPGLNSIVIIPSGILTYPVILFNTEVKSLLLGAGAKINLTTNKVLKLNGQ